MKFVLSIQKSIALNSSRITNLGRWIFFSVFIAVMPIIYNGLNLILNRRPVDLNTILAHGDLILVSIAILADAIGDLVSDDKIKNPFKILMSGSNCFMLIVSCLLFASISLADVQKINRDFITVYSFVSFFWTVVVGAVCKWFVEK